MPKPSAILIAGPTASGKSAVALRVAEAVGGTIINADSMQVYSDLRVLTARPDEEDERRVPHALYGFLDGSEAYSVGRWLQDTGDAIATVRSKGQVPVVTGGTGLYFKALLDGLSPVPGIPADIRERWREEAKRLDGPELHAMLAERDPAMAERLRPTDPQRIVRALEVLEATGQSLADWQQKPGTPLLQESETACFVIAPPREALVSRINSRLSQMVDHGALDEVKALMARELAPDLPIMRALGVKPLAAHLAGKLAMDEAIEQTGAETRQYAKRQMTWAKRNMITWKWFSE